MWIVIATHTDFDTHYFTYECQDEAKESAKMLTSKCWFTSVKYVKHNHKIY